MKYNELNSWYVLKHLISYKLWGRAFFCAKELVVDWKKVYDISKAQTVQGLFVDSAIRLINEARSSESNVTINNPSRNEILTWYASLRQIQLRNQLFIKALRKMNEKFYVEGIRYVVVKGQVCAQRWPDPFLRIPGDIDLLIHPDDFVKASALFKSFGAEVVENAEFKHIEYQLGGICWELHFKLHRFAQSRLQRWLDNQLIQVLENPPTMTIGDENRLMATIPILTPELELSHLLLHFIHHVVHEGCGMRQLIDFAVVLNDSLKKCNINFLKSCITELQLNRSLQVMLCLCEHVLGMSKCPLSHNYSFLEKKMAKKIESRMMSDGNFGHCSGWVKPKGIYGSICYNLRSFRRSLTFICLWPKEEILFPLEVLHRRFQCNIFTTIK